MENNNDTEGRQGQEECRRSASRSNRHEDENPQFTRSSDGRLHQSERASRLYVDADQGGLGSNETLLSVPEEFSFMSPEEYHRAVSVQQGFDDGGIKNDGAAAVTDQDTLTTPRDMPWRNSHEETRLSRESMERKKVAHQMYNKQKPYKSNREPILEINENVFPPRSQSSRHMPDMDDEQDRPDMRPRRGMDSMTSSYSSRSRSANPVSSVSSSSAEYSAASTPRQGNLTVAAAAASQTSSSTASSARSTTVSETRPGAVAVPGIGGARADVNHDEEEGNTIISERPETVVAEVVTSEDLRDELRNELRSEIRQELQAQMHSRVVTAEAVSTTVTPSENESKGSEPSWLDRNKKCLLFMALIVLVAVAAGVVGAIVATNSGGNDASSAGENLTGTGGTSPPGDTPTPTVPGSTTAPANSQPPASGQPPSVPPTPGPTLSPTLPPTSPPSSPPTSSPTPLSTSVEVSLVTITKLEGSGSGDRFGGYVVLSRDSTTMAVGAHDGGYVKVYRKIGDAWNQMGPDIEGRGSFGHRLGLSLDGTVLIAGAWNNDDAADDAGQARVFRYNSGSDRWDQLGQDLNGDEAGDAFGWAVSISDNGETVAVSGRLGDPSSSRVDAGYVHVFTYTGSGWDRLGSVLEGEASVDQFGRSLELSASGRRLAVGAVRGGGGRGRIFVFDFVGSDWTRVGQDLDGEKQEDWQGTSLALSADGSILAIAADGNDTNGSNAGMVRVYQLSGCCNWVQLGQRVLGEEADDQFGAGHISLSDNGQWLAVGGLHNANDRGKGYLFRYNDFKSDWDRVAVVAGDNSGDKFGDTVNLSGDASLFAVGAPNANSNRGYVRVYNVVQ